MVDFAKDFALGESETPPIGGFEARQYTGYSVLAIDYDSTTWAGIHSKLTIVDELENGIERTDSDFEFELSGMYEVIITANFTGDNAVLLGFRIQDAANVTVLKPGFGNTISSTTNLAQTQGVIEVPEDGDVMTIEFCVSAATNNLPALALDGEALRNFSLTIVRIGDLPEP